MAFPLIALAGIGAGLGAIFGGISTKRQGDKAQAELEAQKENAWSQYLLGKEYGDAQYRINRNEAQTGLAIQQNRLGQQVDQSIGQFNTGLLAQAYGIQGAQIQTASNIGASAAAEGMSGTRGNGANGLIRAYEQAGLDRNTDLQYRQNGQALSGLIGQANNAAADIRREGASWEPGGYRFAAKEAQDDYNRKMAELGQTNFDRAIGAAAPGWEDYAVNIFGGASSGLNLASSINSFYNVGGGKK
jgi:hypothetical protein